MNNVSALGLFWGVLFAAQVLLVNAVIDQSNLIAAYITSNSFNGDYNDVLVDRSGNSRNLTIAGNVNSKPSANFSANGEYMDFTETFNDGLQATGLSDYEWSTSWAFSFWFKQTASMNSSNNNIIGNMNADFNAGSFAVFQLMVNDSASCGFGFVTDKNESNGKYLQKYRGLKCDLNEWHHFVLTGGNGVVNAWLDKEEVFINTGGAGDTYNIDAKGKLVASDNPLYVGASAQGLNSFQGSMKNIFLYKQYFTQVDVNFIYDQTSVPGNQDDVSVSWFTKDTFANLDTSPLLSDSSLNGNDLVADDGSDILPTVIQNATTGDSVSFDINSDTRFKSPALGGKAWGTEWGMCLWFKLNELNLPNTALIGNMNGDKENSGSWALYLQNSPSNDDYQRSTLGFAFNTTSHNNNTPSYQKFEDVELEGDDWHQWCMTMNGQIMNAYLNSGAVYFLNVQSYDQPVLGELVTTANDVYVAGTVLGYGNFNGEMKGIYLYDKFLSREEVDKIYHETGHISYAPSSAPTTFPTFAPDPSKPPSSGDSTNSNGQTNQEITGGIVASVVISAVVFASIAYYWYVAGSKTASHLNEPLTDDVKNPVNVSKAIVDNQTSTAQRSEVGSKLAGGGGDVL